MRLRIKELREEFRITQKELAERINNVQRNVSNWENGASEPDCETILKLADFFEVSIDELFGRDGNLEFQPEIKQKSLYGLLKRLNEEQLEAVKNLILSFNKKN